MRQQCSLPLQLYHLVQSCPHYRQNICRELCSWRSLTFVRALLLPAGRICLPAHGEYQACSQRVSYRLGSCFCASGQVAAAAAARRGVLGVELSSLFHNHLEAVICINFSECSCVNVQQTQGQILRSAWCSD